VLLLGVVAGLVAGFLFDSFILGFIVLAVLAGLGRLLLGLFDTDGDRGERRSTSDERQTARENREHQHAHS